jgi:F-type H+-transporting ATPase subunit delta
MSITIASRYARALADVLGLAGDYASTLKELNDFAAVWRESHELREALVSPAVSPEQRRKILDQILERLGSPLTTSNFLRVLLANYRIELLEEVLQAFRKVANERLGIVEVEVSCAYDLSGEQQEAFYAEFQALTGKQVVIRFRRDERLLGGVQARIGSMVYDGSVYGQLERLRELLLAG